MRKSNTCLWSDKFSINVTTLTKSLFAYFSGYCYKVEANSEMRANVISQFPCNPHSIINNEYYDKIKQILSNTENISKAK